MFSIGTLSRRTGVNIQTIRYYERAGVLPKATRAANGRRVYRADDVQRLSFIRHTPELGFELTAVRALLALQEQPEATCELASSIAADHLAAVESRIARLTVLRDELTRMIKACRNGRVAECRIIEELVGSSRESL